MLNFNTSAEFNQHDCLVVLVGKKTELPTAIPALVKAEYDAFAKDPFDEVHQLRIENKWYVFVKPQTDNEKLRIAGFKVRALLPKSVKSMYLAGSKNDAFYFAEGFGLSSYQFLHYRKEVDKERFQLTDVDIQAKLGDAKLNELKVITDVVSWARDLVNEPYSYLTATTLAEEIVKKAENTAVKVTVLEKSMIESLKMGGLLAVNKGSIDPPTFTIMEYKPKKKVNKQPIVLVGKGVVYDTGGLSLKPTAGSMDSMKSDMAGAACMAGTIIAAAELELPFHIIALIPATDNRPGQAAYAPGDIIRMMDGTTVEVLNTDAEGRMILADALAYSNKYKPELVIDAATLTGAAVRAIGQKASCVMGNAKDSVFAKLEKAGMDSYERVVRLPFWDDYFDEMKSKIADLNNLGGGMAGMITAGKFLEHFVKAPYIHMDIAGPAFLERPQDYRGVGGTGTGIRCLIQFLKELEA